MNLVCNYEKNLERNQLAGKVLAAVPARPGADRWFISYSLDKPVFQKATIDADLPAGWDDVTTGGHLFDDLAETKWKQDRGGFHLWTLYESDAEPHAIVNPRRHVLSYYCLGTWNVAARCFRDGRLPDVLGYPLSGSLDNDRVSFKIAEYSSAPPPSVNPGETPGIRMDRMNKELNQPRVVAHRLIGVGVDSGSNVDYAGDL